MRAESLTPHRLLLISVFLGLPRTRQERAGTWLRSPLLSQGILSLLCLRPPPRLGASTCAREQASAHALCCNRCVFVRASTELHGSSSAGAASDAPAMRKAPWRGRTSKLLTSSPMHTGPTQPVWMRPWREAKYIFYMRRDHRVLCILAVKLAKTVCALTWPQIKPQSSNQVFFRGGDYFSHSSFHNL